jgi:glycerol-3-phosphate dehydrogenase
MASNDAVIVGGGTVGVEIALDAFEVGLLAR